MGYGFLVCSRDPIYEINDASLTDEDMNLRLFFGSALRTRSCSKKTALHFLLLIKLHVSSPMEQISCSIRSIMITLHVQTFSSGGYLSLY